VSNPEGIAIKDDVSSLAAPRVSLITPVYETVDWLDEALDSVAAQTFADWEVLVVDDGSRTPRARQVLDGLQRPKVRVLRVPHGGVCRARNRAIAEARGAYLCFFDADDRMRPRFLERACARLDADATLAFVSPWVHLFGDESWDWMPERCDLTMLLGDCSVATAAVVRAEAVRAVGGFDEAMELGHEDWELWLSLVARGHRGEILREVLFDYRRRASSRSTVADRGATYLQLYRQLVRKHAPAYRERLFDLLWEKEVAVGHLIYGTLDAAARLEEKERAATERLAQERAELEALRARVEEAHARIRALENSGSWRVTAPLRRAYELLRGRR
jgi:glycosyltransferase involved in cell wall biosynthesis